MFQGSNSGKFSGKSINTQNGPASHNSLSDSLENPPSSDLDGHQDPMMGLTRVSAFDLQENLKAVSESALVFDFGLMGPRASKLKPRMSMI
jgi:hypothetical protein